MTASDTAIQKQTVGKTRRPSSSNGPGANDAAAPGGAPTSAVAVGVVAYEKSARGSLSKRIYLDAEGTLVADGSACKMGKGTAKAIPAEINRPRLELAP